MKRLTNTLNSGRIYAVYILNNLWWINPPEKEIIFMKRLLSMILAMLMVLSTVSFAAPAMVGTAVTAEEVVTQETAVAEEAVLEAETAFTGTPHSTYGYLLAEIDFESIDSSIIKQYTPEGGETINYISGKGNYLTKKLGVSDTQNQAFVDAWTSTFNVQGGRGASYNANQQAIVVEEEADGNTYVKLEMGSAHTFIQFTGSPFYSENGVYTFVADMMVDTDVTGYSPAVAWLPFLAGTQTWANGAWPTTDYANNVNVWMRDYAISAYDSTKVTCIDIGCNLKSFNTTGRYFAIDNLRMYWKPYEVEVTVDASANTAFKNKTVKVANATRSGVHTTLNKVSLATLEEGFTNTEDKVFAGISLTPNGEILTEDFYVGDDTTVYAKWVDVDFQHDQYGSLIYFNDMESLKNAGTLAGTTSDGVKYIYDGYTLNKFGYTVASDFNSSKITFDTRGSGAVANSKQGWLIKKDENGNHYAYHTITSNDPIQIFYAASGNKFYKDGVYTLVHDIMAEATPNNFHEAYCINNKSEGFKWLNTKYTGTPGKWEYDKVVTYDVALGETDYVSSIIFGFSGKSTAGASYDNIRLYWKPYEVKVTIDANGNSEAQNVVYTADTSKKVDLDALKALMSNTDDKMFIGFSLTPDGELLYDDFWASEDTTIYAQWADYAPEHEQHGKLLFLMDFDNINKNTSLYTKDDENREFINENKAIGYGSYVNLEASDFDAINVAFDTESSVSYDGVTTQNFLLGKESNGNAYASLYSHKNSLVFTWLRNVAAKPFYKTGNYTIVYDVNSTGEITGFLHRYRLNYEKSEGSYTSDYFIKDNRLEKNEYLAANTWHRDIVRVVNHSYVAEKSTADKTYEDISGFSFGVYTPNGSTVKYDNLRVYWKPYTASITINMNGNNDKTVEAYANDTSSKLSLAALASYVGAETANYTLKGFSKTADGEVLIADFWANEDMTLYAIWEAKTDVTPSSCNLSAIRTDAYTGIRFKASITKAQKEEVTEYGFIVTLEKNLGGKELTHTAGVAYVEGINYGVVDGENVDKIYEIVDDDVFFTAVVYGIPETKAAYESNFVVRPFSKRGDYYYYGNPVVRSVYGVATAIREDGYANLKESEIAKIDSILEICEK